MMISKTWLIVAYQAAHKFDQPSYLERKNILVVYLQAIGKLQTWVLKISYRLKRRRVIFAEVMVGRQDSTDFF